MTHDHLFLPIPLPEMVEDLGVYFNRGTFWPNWLTRSIFLLPDSSGSPSWGDLPVKPHTQPLSSYPPKRPKTAPTFFLLDSRITPEPRASAPLLAFASRPTATGPWGRPPTPTADAEASRCVTPWVKRTSRSDVGRDAVVGRCRRPRSSHVSELVEAALT